MGFSSRKGRICSLIVEISKNTPDRKKRRSRQFGTTYCRSGMIGTIAAIQNVKEVMNTS
jgi:hypothetical protein